ncbi:MAG: hypothetical protein HC942_11235 [Microcoleus sp. SU_5_6]|nr:hypothetical protein [Microcoleus sp. SU_5_6]NJL67831.1 hypothetical protein [Microcoleus sp. SM1_3_4]
MNIAGNIFGKFTIHKPNSSTLVIHRQAGAIIWLFMLAYFGVVSFLNIIFLCLLWETLLPRTLTCQQQQQTINCEYAIPGFLSKKTIKIPHTKKAIASPTPNGEVIVLTSSKPWMVLETTSNNAQNIQSINQGLAKLNNGEKSWKLDMYGAKNVRQFILFFLLPVGLLFVAIGVKIIVGLGFTNLELDAAANTVSIVKLGRFRSRLSPFSEFRGADRQVSGHLGILSDKFGIYGGNSYYRRHNYRTVRLLFVFRRPFVFHQQTHPNDGSAEVTDAINSFVTERQA